MSAEAAGPLPPHAGGTRWKGFAWVCVCVCVLSDLGADAAGFLRKEPARVGGIQFLPNSRGKRKLERPWASSRSPLASSSIPKNR